MNLYLKNFMFAYALCTIHITYGLTSEEIDKATAFCHPGIAKRLHQELSPKQDKASASKECIKTLHQEPKKAHNKKICQKLRQTDQSFILKREDNFPCTQFATQQSADTEKLLIQFDKTYNPILIDQYNKVTRLINYWDRLNSLKLTTPSLFLLAATSHHHITKTLHRKPSRLFGFDDAAILSTVVAVLPTICTMVIGGFAYHELKKLFCAEAIAECKILRNEIDFLKSHFGTLTKLLKDSQKNVQNARDELTHTKAEIQQLVTYYQQSSELLKIIDRKVQSTWLHAQKMRTKMEAEHDQEEHKKDENDIVINLQEELNALDIPDSSNDSHEKAPHLIQPLTSRERQHSAPDIEDLKTLTSTISTEIFKKKKTKHETVVGKIYHTIFGHCQKTQN